MQSLRERERYIKPLGRVSTGPGCESPLCSALRSVVVFSMGSPARAHFPITIPRWIAERIGRVKALARGMDLGLCPVHNQVVNP